MDFVLFQRVQRPFADLGRRRNQDNTTSLLDQQFGQNTPHIILVVIVNPHMPHRVGTVHQIIRRENWRRVICRKRHHVLSGHAVAPPLCTCSDTYVFKPKLEDAFRIEFAFKIAFDIWLLAQLVFSAIGYATPRTEAGRMTSMPCDHPRPCLFRPMPRRSHALLQRVRPLAQQDLRRSPKHWS